ncbi:hypothetical protein Dimus_005652 [Dionaea muscipula]
MATSAATGQSYRTKPKREPCLLLFIGIKASLTTPNFGYILYKSTCVNEGPTPDRVGGPVDLEIAKDGEALSCHSQDTRPLCFSVGPIYNPEGINLDVVLCAEGGPVNAGIIHNGLTDNHGTGQLYPGSFGARSVAQSHNDDIENLWLQRFRKGSRKKRLVYNQGREGCNTGEFKEGGDTHGRSPQVCKVGSDSVAKGDNVEHKPKKRGRSTKKRVVVAAATKATCKSLTAYNKSATDVNDIETDAAEKL